MLDDLPVLVKAEYVDPGVILVAGPLLKTVQNNIVTLGERPFEMNALTRVLLRHSLEVGDEGFLPIADMWIVLDVHIADVPIDGLTGFAIVKHQGIEVLGILFVCL